MGVKIREKGGAWWVFITHRGRRKAKRIGHKRTAENVADRLRHKLALGEWPIEEKPQPKPTCPTVREYAERWLTLYADVNLKQSTATGYRYALNRFILPAFGDKGLNDLTRPQVKDYLLRLQAKGEQSSKTIKNVVLVFNSMLTHAVEDELINQHPTKGLGRAIRTAATPSTINPLTLEELSRLLVSAKNNYPGYHALFATLGMTGMRVGEALGLKWGDIQFGKDEKDPNRYIRIERGWVLGSYTTPKSGRTRKVDMGATLRRILLDHKERAEVQAITSGKPLGPVLFASPGGRPKDKSLVWHILHRSLEKAGLRRIRVHDLRHSYATAMLYELHAPIQYVSEQLGHASITMTVNRYGHPRQGTGMTFADTMGGATIRNENDPEICNLSATKDRFRSQVIENMVVPTGIEPVFPA